MNVVEQDSHLTDHIPSTPQRRVLTLADCVGIIVGTIIGAAIFAMPADVAALLPTVQWLFATWVIGGSLALIGALCFAELTTTYPDRGGDYGYLKRGFGRHVGFAFSWAAFWVIRPGNIGAMAMIFGSFAAQVFPNSLTPLALAVISVLLMTGTNLLGVAFGKTTQNVLTVAKVVGILLVVAAAFFSGVAEPASSLANADAPVLMPVDDVVSASSFWSSFGVALVFVMFAFGGWNDIAFVATEVQHPEKNLIRSLLIGTTIVLVIYLLVNLALVIGLGFETMSRMGSERQNPTSALVDLKFGQYGLKLFAVLVCVSCLGAINAMIFTSPRIYWATALDYPSLGWLAGAADSQRGWWRAMSLQGAVTILFVFVFGSRGEGIDKIVASTAPYFWFFLALTVISLMICRMRFRGQFKGFRVPLYPLLPMIFVLACGFIIWQAASYIWMRGWWLSTLSIGAWVLAGMGLSLALRSREEQTSDN